MTVLPVADIQRCGLPTSSGRPCRCAGNCRWHGRSDNQGLRRQAYERWAAGERPRHIAADWGVDSRTVRNWVEWYRKRVPAAEADYAAMMSRHRRRMLELRNAGYSYEAIGQQYGISASTVFSYVRRAQAELGPDEQVTEPVLDWLRERLADEPDGLVPEVLRAEADAAMEYPVCRKLLQDKLRQAGWQVRGGVLCRHRPGDLQAALEARHRATRLEILNRREAGETESELAAAYGVEMHYVHCVVGVARAENGRQTPLAELPAKRREWVAGHIRRRRRSLELRNAGAPLAYVAEQLGCSAAHAYYLVRMAGYDAVSPDPDRAMGPVAEPLLDWLAGLPGYWVGLPAVELEARAAAAMGHPVDRPVLDEKLAASDWELRQGVLARRVAADALAMREAA